MTEKVRVRIFLMENGSLPEYQTEGSSGADLRSSEETVILPGQTAIVGTGIRMEIPGGWEVQIRPRSGLAAKHSVTVLNAPGTVDSDYRGEVKVILHNAGKEPFHIRRGDRIAQMVIAKADQAWFDAVDREEELDGTARGSGGFGSTGVR
jgi:dUTP pyrophosphatase